MKNLVLPICNFLSKGWEVSLLGLLIFFQQQYGLDIYTIGLLSAVFIVCQISISIFAGHFAHTLGSKNVILLAISASGVAWLIVLLTHHLYALYFAYACGGMSSGLFEPIGNSLVAKSATAKNRSSSIGNFAAYGDMGRIALLAAATSAAGSLGVTYTSLALVATTAVAFGLALMINGKKSGSGSESHHEHHIPIRSLYGNHKFRHATFAGIADSFSSSSLYIFIPFLLSAKGIPAAETGRYTVALFVGYFLGRLALGRLSDKHGAPITLMVSKVAMAALILLLTVVAPGGILIYAVIFMLGIFTRGSSPIIRAMVADSMHEKASFHNAFSAYSFASRGATALSRPIFGYLASFTGIASVFYAASAVSLFTLYPAVRYREASSEPASTD